MRVAMTLLVITVMVIFLTSCTKIDYDLNPWTTIMKEIITYDIRK